jgi:hypothetical protein
LYYFFTIAQELILGMRTIDDGARDQKHSGQLHEV